MDFVNNADRNMGTIERVWAGLPGVKEYRSKELRREADHQVRTTLATYLDTLRSRLTGMEQTLLSGGGIAYLGDLERAVGKLQLLIDRVRTATYGYAGFFDAVKVREGQIEALANFDQQLAQKANGLEAQINALGEAMDKNEKIADAIHSLTNAIQGLNDLFAQRAQAIQSPDSLTPSTIAPDALGSAAARQENSQPNQANPAPPTAPLTPPTPASAGSASSQTAASEQSHSTLQMPDTGSSAQPASGPQTSPASQTPPSHAA